MTFLALAVVWSSLTADPPYIRSRADPSDANSACLHWVAGTLTMQQSSLGDPSLPDGSEFAAISRAIQSWKTQMDSCGNLQLGEGAHVDSRQTGYVVGSANQNVVLFRMNDCQVTVDPSDPCWDAGVCGNTHDCWEHSSGIIALTTTSYEPTTGKLFDADIEGNASEFLFTTVDSPLCSYADQSTDCVAFDVQNTFTHEMGHVLGLAHTQYPGSIMNPTAPEGDLSKRDIDPGSLSFVCEAYPAGMVSTNCLPTPAAVAGSSVSCASARVAPSVWLAAGVLLFAARRRRRLV